MRATATKCHWAVPTSLKISSASATLLPMLVRIPRPDKKSLLDFFLLLEVKSGQQRISHHHQRTLNTSQTYFCQILLQCFFFFINSSLRTEEGALRSDEEVGDGWKKLKSRNRYHLKWPWLTLGQDAHQVNYLNPGSWWSWWWSCTKKGNYQWNCFRIFLTDQWGVHWPIRILQTRSNDNHVYLLKWPSMMK